MIFQITIGAIILYIMFTIARVNNRLRKVIKILDKKYTIQETIDITQESDNQNRKLEQINQIVNAIKTTDCEFNDYELTIIMNLIKGDYLIPKFYTRSELEKLIERNIPDEEWYGNWRFNKLEKITDLFVKMYLLDFFPIITE